MLHNAETLICELAQRYFTRNAAIALRLDSTSLDPMPSGSDINEIFETRIESQDVSSQNANFRHSKIVSGTVGDHADYST
jgi:hypothetical protein